MKQFRVVAPYLLLAGSAALAQSPWITSTPAKPAAPAQSQVPSQAVTTVVTPAEPPVADPKAAVPATNPRSIWRGPQTLTITYPPGKGASYILVTEGISLAADGYFRPHDPGNIFRINLPPTTWRRPMTLTCSVRGRPNTHTNLWWYYGSGDSLRGGGAGLSFPAGEGELRYAFGPGVTTYGNSRATSASMSAIYFTLPMDTGVKSCQVSGTFDQPPG